MDIQAKTRENVILLTVKGTLNVTYTPRFQEKIQEHVPSSAQYVVLDCSQVDYISSIGLRAILELGKMLQARGGKLALVAKDGFTSQIFDNAGFTLLFPLKSTVEAAEATIKGGVKADT